MQKPCAIFRFSISRIIRLQYVTENNIRNRTQCGRQVVTLFEFYTGRASCMYSNVIKTDITRTEDIARIQAGVHRPILLFEFDPICTNVELNVPYILIKPLRYIDTVVRVYSTIFIIWLWWMSLFLCFLCGLLQL